MTPASSSRAATASDGLQQREGDHRYAPSRRLTPSGAVMTLGDHQQEAEHGEHRDDADVALLLRQQADAGDQRRQQRRDDGEAEPERRAGGAAELREVVRSIVNWDRS